MSEIEIDVIHTGDCFDVVEQLPDNSVHAVVTDPPYGLAFMGKSWDDFEPKEYQQWCEKWANEVLRVLKPGGHLLAFSGNRTHHRLFTGVEDAGFEIRDTITWHYGSGFPKAADVAKVIDKRVDADREVVGEKDVGPDMTGGNYGRDGGDRKMQEITEPATDDAKEWDGFKTSLKPATEYVVVARKPFGGATVDCVLEHGTGALNIDDTRIGGGDEGRYPANVVFDEAAAMRLDGEVGETSSGGGQSRNGDKTATERYTDEGGTNFAAEPGERRGDSGGPSRYFYTSKASRSERTEGGAIVNDHPTVKPVDLMEWLVKLVTAEGQIVLDPFCGSGTTCKAAKTVNRRFVGIEKQAKWADVARVRCGLTPEDADTVRDSDDQKGLEEFC